MKKITLDQIEEAITKSFNSEEESQRIHAIVREVVAKFSGKTVSKRIENAMAKARPDWVVYFRPQYGMFHLDIYGGDTNRKSDNRISFLLAYNSSPVIDMDRFDDHNASTGSAAKARNEGRKNLLANRMTLAKVADATNVVIAERKTLDGLISDLRDKEVNAFETYEVEKIVEECLK